MKIIIDDFFINFSLNLDSYSIGKIIKNLIHNENNQLNKDEDFLFNYISKFNFDKRQKRQNAVNKRWQKVKQEKQEQTQQIQKKETTKIDTAPPKQKQYNKNKPNYSPSPINKQNSTIPDYLKRGSLNI